MTHLFSDQILNKYLNCQNALLMPMCWQYN